VWWWAQATLRSAAENLRNRATSRADFLQQDLLLVSRLINVTARKWRWNDDALTLPSRPAPRL
jgi:hypothetical protein